MRLNRRQFCSVAVCTLTVARTASSVPGTAAAKVRTETLKFYSDVYAWDPSGQVKKVSQGDGIYYQACVHPRGTDVIYSGGTKGPPRIWQTHLKTGTTEALTPEGVSARHPVYSVDGSRIAFAADFDHEQKPDRLEDMETLHSSASWI